VTRRRRLSLTHEYDVGKSSTADTIFQSPFTLITMTVSTPFKAAVLVNSISALDHAFRDAFQECIKSACPGAQVDFFDPIEAQIYPEPAQYELIILSGGGTADPMAKDIPWVLKMQEFLRTTVEKCPKQKIVGICWGHETINIAFGGMVGPMDKFEVCSLLAYESAACSR
jgi:hypothetical protein